MFSLLSYSIEILNCCTFGIDASPSEHKSRVRKVAKLLKIGFRICEARACLWNVGRPRREVSRCEAARDLRRGLSQTFLLGKQVLEVELGLNRAEHEVGVVQAQMLLVGVGGEGSTAARPVLERSGRGLAGERAHVGVQAAADLARVDDDDLACAACLGVTVQMNLEPAVLKGGVVRHIGVLLHELEQLLLQLVRL